MNMNQPKHSMMAVMAALALALLGQGSVAAQESSNPAARPLKGNFGGWSGTVERHINRAKEGNVDVLFLGDSITAGWNKAVWEEYFGDLKPVNFGIPADRTEHVLYRINQGTLDGISPKLVVLLIGTNNLKSGKVRHPPKFAADGVRTVIDEVLKRLPDTKILLMGIFPRQPTYEWIDATIKDANARIQRFASDDRIFYMDIGGRFLGADGKVDVNLMPDYLHPNEAGYRRWSEDIIEPVRALMGLTPSTVRGTGNGNDPTAYPPIQWCPEHNYRWTFALPKAPASAPVLRGPRLFVTLAGPTPALICVNSENGKQAWACSPKSGQSPARAVDPVATDAHVFSAWSDGTVLCANTAGTTAWERRVDGSAPSHLFLASEGLIVYGATATCLDVNTGAARWQTKLPAATAAGDPVSCGSFILTPSGQKIACADGSVTPSEIPAWKTCRPLYHFGKLFVAGITTDGGGRVCRYNVDPKTGAMKEAWSADWKTKTEGLAAPVLRQGRLYTVSAEGDLKVWESTDGSLLQSLKLWKSATPVPVSDRLAVWTTGDHLYARSNDPAAERVVLSLRGDFNRVWSYRMDGTDATDTIGEFLHVVGNGRALVAYGGSTHVAPTELPSVVSVTPDTDRDKGWEGVPVTKLEMDHPVINWFLAVPGEAGEPKFGPMPEAGIWTHERYTGGKPTIDLTALADRTVPADFALRAVLRVEAESTVGWRLIPASAEVWTRDDLLLGKLFVAGKEIERYGYVHLLPGDYGVELRIRRGVVEKDGRIWMTPMFFPAPAADQLAADRARYEAEKAHWEACQQQRQETFVVKPSE
jgi:beta-glucosidase